MVQGSQFPAVASPMAGWGVSELGGVSAMGAHAVAVAGGVRCAGRGQAVGRPWAMGPIGFAGASTPSRQRFKLARPSTAGSSEVGSSQSPAWLYVLLVLAALLASSWRRCG